jgi:hypothetical protein
VATALVAAALLVVRGETALAQGPWGLTLFVDPFPSPYQSDWETNPNISTLTITSPATVEQDVVLVYQIANTQGRILATGRSDALGIPSGAPTVLTKILEIPGSSRADRAMQDQMERTGRIPEGTYRGCVTMMAGSGFVLGEDCATFTIVYPDPPILMAPTAGEAVAVPAPWFQWTPIQVPPAYQVEYTLQIAELRPNQTPEEALNSSIPHYQGPGIDVTNLQYPPEGQPFEPGKFYAWRVVALDQHGFPPSANGGSSEIRTFHYDDGTSLHPGLSSDISLSLANAFDHDSSDASQTTTASAETPVDIAQLCAMWNDPPSSVTITSDSPFGLKRFAGQPAVLYRDSAATKWWITTKSPNDRRAVLIGGDCGGFGGKTRTRWIASKNQEFQEKVSGMLGALPAGLPTPVGTVNAVKFGVVILALGAETVEVPGGFREGSEFLAGQTLDVAPGLSVRTLLGLQDWGLWKFFKWMGFGEKEVTITGFLGWDASWSLGGAVGQDAGVDLSTERSFLVLRADLPKRTPEGPLKGLVDEMGLSIELSVGDSLGRAFGPEGKQKKYSLDIEGKLIHTIQINEELSLEGSVGLDLSRESNKGIGQEVLGRWDWFRGVRRSASEGIGSGNWATRWLGGKVAPPDFVEPEWGLDLMLSYAVQGRIGSLWRSDTAAVRVDGVALDVKLSLTEDEATVALSGTVAAGAVDEAFKLGVSKDFKWGAPVDTVALKDKVAELETRLSERVAAVQGDLPDCGGFAARNHEVCKALRDLRREQKKLKDERSPGASWRVRLSAGHMSLGEMLDLLKGVRQ